MRKVTRRDSKSRGYRLSTAHFGSRSPSKHLVVVVDVMVEELEDGNVIPKFFGVKIEGYNQRKTIELIKEFKNDYSEVVLYDWNELNIIKFLRLLEFFSERDYSVHVFSESLNYLLYLGHGKIIDVFDPQDKVNVDKENETYNTDTVIYNLSSMDSLLNLTEAEHIMHTGKSKPFAQYNPIRVNPEFPKFAVYSNQRRPSLKLTFIDIHNYVDIPLSKMYADFGEEYIDYDYTKPCAEQMEVAKQRVMTTCKVVSELLKYFLGRFCQGSEIPISISSAGFNYLRNNPCHLKFNEEKGIYESIIMIPNVPEVLKNELDAYLGARTEVYQVGKIREPIYVVDVNNLYGYVMRNYYIPTKNKPLRVYRGVDRNFIDFELMSMVTQDLKKSHELGGQKTLGIIAKCLVNVPKELPVGPFAVRGKNEDGLEKLTFPVGEFEAMLCTGSFLHALEQGYLVGVYEYSEYECEKYFDSFVKEMEDIRKEAIDGGKSFLKYISKMIPNHTIGKFGQQDKFYRYNRFESNIEFYNNRDTYDKEGTHYKERKQGHHVYRKKANPEMPVDNAFPAISAHITDYARMYMYHMTVLTGFENIFYTDNDSLFINQEGFDRLDGDGHIDRTDSVLGKFKIECQGYADILGAKTYKVYSNNEYTGQVLKQAQAGIPLNAVEENGEFVFYSRGMQDGKVIKRQHKVSPIYEKLNNREIDKDTGKTTPIEMSFGNVPVKIEKENKSKPTISEDINIIDLYNANNQEGWD